MINHESLEEEKELSSITNFNSDLLKYIQWYLNSKKVNKIYIRAIDEKEKDTISSVISSQFCRNSLSLSHKYPIDENETKVAEEEIVFDWNQIVIKSEFEQTEELTDFDTELLDIIPETAEKTYNRVNSITEEISKDQCKSIVRELKKHNRTIEICNK